MELEEDHRKSFTSLVAATSSVDVEETTESQKESQVEEGDTDTFHSESDVIETNVRFQERCSIIPGVEVTFCMANFPWNSVDIGF